MNIPIVLIDEHIPGKGDQQTIERQVLGSNQL